MQDQIAATLAFLDSIDRAALDGDLDRMVSFELPNGMVFDLSAFDYVRDWAVPQFAFHRTMAYALLRPMGVPLGTAASVSYMMRHLSPGTAPDARRTASPVSPEQPPLI